MQTLCMMNLSPQGWNILTPVSLRHPVGNSSSAKPQLSRENARVENTKWSLTYKIELVFTINCELQN